MTPPTPTELRWRRRIETVLRVVHPALDLVLIVGDRVSRAVERSPDDVPALAPPAALRPALARRGERPS